MYHRRCCNLLVLLSACLSGALGCRPATFFAGAAISQNAPWRAGRNASCPWTFPGLDPRVPPRIRPGSYATATNNVRFLDAASLGPHSYRFIWSERNGIIYTCRAGHIDIAHVRKAADCTGYLAAVALEHIERGETRFLCKLIEPSVYFISLTFPPNWDDLDDTERERIARCVSRELAQYLAFTSLTWHEIITWFGYRPRPYKSEFPSAFSWEDTYSNLLGVHIAAAALEDEHFAFSEAVTMVLEKRIDELGGQPAEVARQAAEAMKGKWYSKHLFSTNIWMRCFDVGLDDGYVTPCLVPSLAVCEGAQPLPLAVPVLDNLAKYGFSARVEIEAKVWEQKKILAVLDAMAGRASALRSGPPAARLDPAVHFPLIIRYIEALAAERWSHVY